MFVSGLSKRRDLRAEARARIRREFAQVRLDAGVLQAPRQVGNSTIYTGRVARDGGMTYIGANGAPHVEVRAPDELRSIVDQLVGKPITLDHPDGMVSAGAAAKVIGHVVNAYVEDGAPSYAVADLQIDDADARNAIADGQSQLSLGYTVDLDGDRQTNTRVDHVAVVRHARCGGACSMRTDCGGSCGCTSCTTKRLADHPLFREESPVSREPKIDPLTDERAAMDRAARRDLSIHYQPKDRISPPSDRTLADLDAPATDDDLTSMEAAERRAFLRNT